MKISISGDGGCGKDTLALWMKEHTILTYTKSTSAYVKTQMYKHMVSLGRDYDNEEECYNDRVNNREEWATFIDEYNKIDPARLYKDCLKEQDILTGVRRAKEFDAVRDLGVIDLCIWVRHPGTPVDPTQGYRADRCDVTILNDTFEGFYERAYRLCRCLGILKRQTKADITRETLKNLNSGQTTPGGQIL
jgi:hypothetical protein